MANTLNLGNGDWATKENSLLGYNSENGNYKPLPFDFTRASNGTFVNKSGLIETAANGVPRIDFLGNTSGALLLEPQRTNILLYSESFDNAYWNKFGSSVASGFTSPDGASNAYKLVEDSANTPHGLLRSNFPINVQRTLSVFAKKGENDRVFISDYNKFGATIGVIFNLSSGIVESNQNNSVYLNPKIESYLNGWYKCSVTWTNTTGLTVPFFGNAISGTNSYQGDGVSGIYVFGATFEEESYATSYIPTQGSAVTRVADVCNNGGNDQVINSTEGVLYVETKGFTDLPTQSSYIQLSKSEEASFNNSLVLQHRNNGYLRVYVNGSATADIHFNINIDFTENHKIAVLYKLNGYKLFIDGVEQNLYGTPTETVFSGLNDLSFDNRGANSWNGKIKDLKLYNTALTDSELATLTSL